MSNEGRPMLRGPTLPALPLFMCGIILFYSQYFIIVSLVCVSLLYVSELKAHYVYATPVQLWTVSVLTVFFFSIGCPCFSIDGCLLEVARHICCDNAPFPAILHVLSTKLIMARQILFKVQHKPKACNICHRQRSYIKAAVYIISSIYYLIILRV